MTAIDKKPPRSRERGGEGIVGASANARPHSVHNRNPAMWKRNLKVSLSLVEVKKEHARSERYPFSTCPR